MDPHATNSVDELSKTGTIVRHLRRGLAVEDLGALVAGPIDGESEVFDMFGTIDDDAEPLLDVLRRTFVPNRVISIVEDGEERKAHAKLVPLLRYKVAQKGKTTVYVCQNQVCKLPTSEAKVFAEQLEKRP